MIDLHIHSRYSDGRLSPKEIIDIASRNKVKCISITDHDTIDAYTDEFYNYASQNNVNVINGVEISSKVGNVNVHVLGYNFNINNQDLKEKIKFAKKSRHIYLEEVSKKLEEVGYKVDFDKLNAIDAVTKAHIALDVIQNPLNKELLNKDFGHIPNKGEFIEEIMNEGCKAYVKKHSLTPREAAETIRNAGGKVVIAHPMVFENKYGLSLDFVDDLVQEMGADGIESNFIYIDKRENRIDERSKWNKYAKENGLIPTIGSDFRYSDGVRPELGFITDNLEIKENDLDIIINRLIEE